MGVHGLIGQLDSQQIMDNVCNFTETAKRMWKKITALMISIAACQESLHVKNNFFEGLNHAVGHVYVLCAYNKWSVALEVWGAINVFKIKSCCGLWHRHQ